MNKAFKIVIGCLLLLFVTINAKAGKLEKGFEALKIHDYFKAKATFYKTLKKDSAASAYGLSVIYSRNNNPFYNLDSALLYSKLSVVTYFEFSTEKQKEKYSLISVDSVSILKQRTIVDGVCFEFAEQQNTIEGYNYFIKKNAGAKEISQAIVNRDKLAFSIAKNVNSSKAYKEFMEVYPKARQTVEVDVLYQERLFEEYTQDGTLESNVKFVREQPKNVHVKEAQRNIYQIATKEKSVEAYFNFVTRYPNNPSVAKAWRNIYNISTQIKTSRNLKRFLEKYPQYPFKEELEEDFVLSNMKYYPIKTEDKWGFVDDQLKEVIPAIYDGVTDFQEGASGVELDGKMGFINKKNVKLIPFEYEEVESFGKGLAVVGNNEKYGVINRSGELVIPLMYDEIGSTHSKFISVELDGKYGFIDHKGELKVGLQYESVGDFNNGIAYVKLNGLFGIIDTNLLYVVKPKYQWIDNLENDFIRVQEKDSFGVINTVGDYIVQPIYNQITEIENGYSLVVKDGLYGYINNKGGIVIELSIPYSSGVVNWGLFNANGYARIISKDKFGLIDTVGNRFVPALFEDVGSVSPDLIAIKRHGKWGYCDYKTKLKIPYNFDFSSQFHGDYAIVQLEGLYGIIDKKGTYVVEPIYEELSWFEGLVMCKKEGEYGLIKMDETEVLPLKYDKIELTNDRAFLKLFSGNSFSYESVQLLNQE